MYSVVRYSCKKNSEAENKSFLSFLVRSCASQRLGFRAAQPRAGTARVGLELVGQGW